MCRPIGGFQFSSDHGGRSCPSTMIAAMTLVAAPGPFSWAALQDATPPTPYRSLCRW
jgi:hypothetical protein